MYIDPENFLSLNRKRELRFGPLTLTVILRSLFSLPKKIISVFAWLAFYIDHSPRALSNPSS